MKYRESEEMYLETILLLKRQKGNVRSLDIADELKYSRASVSRGMTLLRQKGFITFNESQMINFTEIGEKKAVEIYERHSILTKMLIKIGASNEIATENACRLEHVITPELLDIIKDFLKK